MQTDVDIAICGAGPVGLALAVMLVQRGIAPSCIALIDARPAQQAVRDPRSIALSWGSRQILEQLDAWPSAATAIEQIHVSRRGHFGRTLIDRSAYRLPALGYVLRYGAIVEALERQVAKSGIRLIRPATVTGILDVEGGARIVFGNQPSLVARLVVQAEGGVFGEQERKKLHRDYEQTAVVAHVKADAPVPHRAFERFCDEGPLALLPQEDGYALVWCVRPESARRLLALEDRKFLEELGHAFGTRLGRFTGVSPRGAFALGLNAHVADRRHVVAIGNAAQTLHPVAGQGLNLGLRDATVLANILQTESLENAALLFTAARRSDRRTTTRLTDLMARIFASSPQGSPVQGILGLSLGCIDGLPSAKKLLAEQMMYGRRN
ncbi:hypothetical protein GCM10007205_26040 [Oxalicibacterium flavum]|uniref:FAD-binding domain-containing protein n=1 Tax=Oxalicibacterium flavum TaxID=179467 RepID=A0A8J2XVJ6_9BURK|nr:FAD-dependent monooxygenase [Oxalicibacterium flavum]GGC15881.1 hypothetical protein GCM10007205_26040 [Oxalicibacterium flavum]